MVEYEALLQAIQRLIKQWEDLCVEQGETPVSIYYVSSSILDSKGKQDRDYRIFGAPATVSSAFENLQSILKTGEGKMTAEFITLGKVN